MFSPINLIKIDHEYDSLKVQQKGATSGAEGEVEGLSC